VSAEGVFEGWAIVELFGHRRLAGYVREQEIAGSTFVRLDVPDVAPDADPDAAVATQYYNPSAVYCLTPTSETTARAVAALSQPAPVKRWELPAATPEDASERRDDDLERGEW
jgi:hypothetical protein